MTVKMNHGDVMREFEKKQTVFLTKTGIMGTNIAALNMGKDGKTHVDTGRSRVSKQFTRTEKDTIRLEAPVEYDAYLESRYGIMARALDELKPFIDKFQAESFG